MISLPIAPSCKNLKWLLSGEMSIDGIREVQPGSNRVKLTGKEAKLEDVFRTGMPLEDLSTMIGFTQDWCILNLLKHLFSFL